VTLELKQHGLANSGEIEFVISDTGIGISAEKLKTIFDDFTQADSTTTRKYGGTGLGLGISRRLVEGMHGSLTVTSSVGGGSIFRFNALFGLAPQHERKLPIELQDLHSRRVLVIDDDATNRLILQEALLAWGLESDTFGAPKDALAHLAEVMAGGKPYSLVLLDSCMSGMDGFEAAAEIRRIAPGLPVVLLTSDVRLGDIERRREAGVASYAVKPVGRATLLRVICDVMKRTRRPDAAGGNGDRLTEKVLKILIG